MTSRHPLDLRDVLLQKHAPAVMVPRHGPLPSMQKAGHRYLVASDGVWLEVLRPWLHARTMVARSDIALPFGAVDFALITSFSYEDQEGIERRFLADACRAFPDECAAWAVYSERTNELHYRLLTPDVATPTSITFQRPYLADHEHLAIDLHSHGALPAGFSSTDDADDAGEVKFSTVLGSLDREITVASRLCLLGLFTDQDSGVRIA